MRKALYASKVVAYAQGFEQMTAAAKSEGWELDIGAHGDDLARRLHHPRALPRPHQRGLRHEPGPAEPAARAYFRDAVADAQDSWRRVISPRSSSGLPVPAFSSSLAYYDGYRRERGPANLIQGLRDFFGAHTYRRVDEEGTFHVRWGQDGERGAHGRAISACAGSPRSRGMTVLRAAFRDDSRRGMCTS